MKRLKYSFEEEARIFDILQDFRLQDNYFYFRLIGFHVDCMDRKTSHVSLEDYTEIIDGEFEEELICQRFSSNYFNDLANSVHIPLFLAEVHLQAEKAGLGYAVASNRVITRMATKALRESRAYLRLVKELADRTVKACELMGQLRAPGNESPRAAALKKTIVDKAMRTKFSFIPLSMLCSKSRKAGENPEITYAFTVLTDSPYCDKDIYLIKENAVSFLHIPTEGSNRAFESQVEQVADYVR